MKLLNQANMKIYGSLIRGIFLIALLVFTAAVLLAAEKFTLPEAAKQALREQAQQMMDAALRDDDAALVQRMYPKVVEKMGGPEKARKIIEASRQNLKNEGATVISSTIGDIRECKEIKTQIQCVIDGTQVMRISGGRLVTQTETLAFSDDDGKHWTFFNGGQDPEALRRNLPELSPDLPLRKQLPPKFEPK
jgi:hypothetical protein